MSEYAIILASGAGTRAGGDIPKQFRVVAGRPLFYWALRAFAETRPFCEIVAVVHPDYVDTWNTLMASLPEEERIECHLSTGGASRIESVRCGLAKVRSLAGESSDPVVAVHDAARPMVTRMIIDSGFCLAEYKNAVIVPVVPVSDSLRDVKAGEDESVPVDRSDFRAVQTPQTARLSWFEKGYSLPTKPSHTDDASILQDAGYPVVLIKGDPVNMKVTTMMDFLIAEALLTDRSDF